MHRNGDQTIPADLRPVVYRGVISEGDEETLEMMLKVFNLNKQANSWQCFVPLTTLKFT